MSIVTLICATQNIAAEGTQETGISDRVRQVPASAKCQTWRNLSPVAPLTNMDEI